MLSPAISLLFLTGLGGAATSYLSYCLHEGQRLKIKPVWLPALSGDDEIIMEVLPPADKLHYLAIVHFGDDVVRRVELDGNLSELLRVIKSFRPSPNSDDFATEFNTYMGRIKNQIAPERKAIPAAREAIAPRQISQPKTPPPLESDIWDEPIAPSPLENPEDDLVNPVYLDDPSDDNWEVPQTRKKQERVVPIKDIAQDIANFEKGNESHWCFVSPPRVGKSTLLLSAIAKMTGTIYLVDCKGDDTRLRNSRKLNPEVKYININTGEKIDKLFELLDYLEDELIHRQGGSKKHPITLIVDELNQLTITMNAYEMRTGRRNLFKLFSSTLLRLVGQGLSSQIKVVFSTHSLRVEDLFGNGATLHQVSVVGLGKKDKIASLKDVITYKVDDDDKSRIRSDMLSAIEQNPDEVIAILVYGVPRVISLPYVDYSHLETVETTATKATRSTPPIFDDEPTIDPEPTPSFSPNDLLTWLEKKGDGHYKPRDISASNKKIPVAQIVEAANGLHTAGVIELKNWGELQGREIVYFKPQKASAYRDNLVAFPMGV